MTALLGDLEHRDDEDGGDIACAERANSKGNELYRNGFFKLAVEAYTSSVEAAATVADGATLRSKYYANRYVHAR